MNCHDLPLILVCRHHPRGGRRPQTRLKSHTSLLIQPCIAPRCYFHPPHQRCLLPRRLPPSLRASAPARGIKKEEPRSPRERRMQSVQGRGKGGREGRVGRASNLGERERGRGGRPLGCGKSAHHCPILMPFFWVEEMGQVRVKLNPRLATGPNSNFETF